MIRHVNSLVSNEYWKHCLDCLQNVYPEAPVLIIDDNSRTDLITSFEPPANVTVIESEFPGAGELLAYYYFWKLHPFDTAVVVHDSLFLHGQLNEIETTTIKFLWHFHHTWDDPSGIQFFLQKLKQAPDLYLNKYTAKDWNGCFGLQAIVNWEFLNQVQINHDLFGLLPEIKNRKQRCCLERVFGVICCLEDPSARNSLYGYIHHWQPFGTYNYSKYQNDLLEGKLTRKIIKVWTGR